MRFVVRFAEIYFVDFKQRKIALAVFRRADFARYSVASAQIKSAYLTRRDIDVVWAREV